MSRVANSADNKPQYFCRCDCGKSSIVLGKLLRTGHTLSCGCIRYERLKKSITKHGYSFTKTYNVWCAMTARCTNKNCHAYHSYGGRGIFVCDRWKNNFQNFLLDMGHKPKGHTIDRINVNGNYEPTNCRWATPLEQANNRRGNIMLTYDGITQTISDWARQLNLSRNMLWTRYSKGQTVKEILEVPRHVPIKVIFMGQLMTYPQIARTVGMPYVTLRWRLRKGMPLSKAII